MVERGREEIIILATKYSVIPSTIIMDVDVGDGPGREGGRASVTRSLFGGRTDHEISNIEDQVFLSLPFAVHEQLFQS